MTKKLYYTDPLAAAYIDLGNGQQAIVDAEDFEVLSRHNWGVCGVKQRPYARTTTWDGKKQKHIRMHRLIMNAPHGVHIDHINGNTLDNRKNNLRLCNDMQNQRNAASRKNSSSNYKGVSFHKRDKRWLAQIRINKKLKYIGSYNNEEEAALAYNKAAAENFGEFARLNDV